MNNFFFGYVLGMMSFLVLLALIHGASERRHHEPEILWASEDEIRAQWDDPISLWLRERDEPGYRGRGQWG